MTLILTTVALYVLHRLGPIAVDIVRRHLANAAIASFEPTLVPAVDAFVAGYTASSTQKARLAALLEASSAATSALYRATSAWLGPIGRDLPGFDGRGFGVNPSVDEDVIADARRLLDVARSEGEHLPYVAGLVEEVSRRIEEAYAAHSAAQQARVTLQEQQARTRASGVVLQRELVALRRTLKAELGARHVDSQRLRVPRVRGAAEVLAETDDAPEVAPSDGTHPTGNGRDSQP